MYAKQPIRQFIKELSSDAPYPGGGSAACLVSSVAVSLALMVGKILEKKKKKQTPPIPLEDLRAALKELEKVNRQALQAIDGDVKAYKKVIKAYALDKSRPGRAGKIEEALQGGYLSQKNFAQLLIRAAELQRVVAQLAQGSIASDLVLSRHFLKAGFLGACQTARVNLEYMKNQEYKTQGFQTLEQMAADFNRAIET